MKVRAMSFTGKYNLSVQAEDVKSTFSKNDIQDPGTKLDWNAENKIFYHRGTETLEK